MTNRLPADNCLVPGAHDQFRLRMQKSIGIVINAGLSGLGDPVCPMKLITVKLLLVDDLFVVK